MGRSAEPKPLLDDLGVEVDLREALRAETDSEIAYDVNQGWNRFAATTSGKGSNAAAQQTPTPATTPAATHRLGRYTLYAQIGSGGMATIHLARVDGAAGFGRTIAIKRLRPHLASDRDFTAMFVDEARLAARIRHPNVVPTLDVIAESGELFLAMEYVHGESLARLLRAAAKSGEEVPVRIVASILAGVLHGLHAAHEAKSEKGEPLQIVHRDVSPQNILVDVEGVAHVLDFGVAKAVGRLYTTRKGALKGKLGYMPPEQFTEKPMTRQADIYAAAVVFWEALTHKRLFHGENQAATLTRILEAELDPPSTHVAVPVGVDAIVMRGLARDLSIRYATAKDMALAIERDIEIAPASEVAAWVRRVAKESIEERDATIAEIESDAAGRSSKLPSAIESGPVARQEAPAPPKRTGRAVWLAVVVGIGVATAAWFALRERHPTAPAVTSSPAASIPQPLATPAASASTSTSPPLASEAPRQTRPATRHDFAPPTNTCDPPYTVDANGHRHYKPNCFK